MSEPKKKKSFWNIYFRILTSITALIRTRKITRLLHWSGLEMMKGIRLSLDFGLRVASWHVYFILCCSLSHYAGNLLLFSMILHEDCKEVLYFDIAALIFVFSAKSSVSGLVKNSYGHGNITLIIVRLVLRHIHSGIIRYISSLNEQLLYGYVPC